MAYPFESPEEAMERIKPFISDMQLAKQALASGLGGNTPEWVVDGILFLLSNTLVMQNIKDKVLDIYGNHWLPDTLPHLIDSSDTPNLN